MPGVENKLPALSLTLLCAVVGLIGNFLIGDGAFGIAFPLWIMLIVGMAALLLRSAHIPLSRETAFWLIVALVFSAGMAWRDAIALRVFNFLATFCALVMAAASCQRSRSLLLSSSIPEIVRAFVSVCLHMLTGVFSFMSDASLYHARKPKHMTLSRMLRAACFAVVVFIIFLALLRSADPVFASFATIPTIDFASLMRHVVVSIIFIIAIFGAALCALKEKSVPRDSVQAREFWQLGHLEIGLALGVLTILFVAFVLAQVSWLFGGEQFLQERTGLLVAEYARSGFFQLVIVVVLAVPLLITSRALLLPSRSVARLHTVLALPIIGLLSMMIVSSTMKLKLYVTYYGLSIDRLYTLIFLVWLGVVLLWLALTVLRDRNTAFPSGVIISAMVMLVLLNIFVPDRIVARVNVARSEALVEPLPLDLIYLANLSAEAIEFSLAAILTTIPTSEEHQQEVCNAATILQKRWGSLESKKAWRFFNAGVLEAQRIVSAHSEVLDQICAQDGDAEVK